jgi:hypothetical protein
LEPLPFEISNNEVKYSNKRLKSTAGSQVASYKTADALSAKGRVLKIKGVDSKASGKQRFSEALEEETKSIRNNGMSVRNKLNLLKTSELKEGEGSKVGTIRTKVASSCRHSVAGSQLAGSVALSKMSKPAE